MIHCRCIPCSNQTQIIVIGDLYPNVCITIKNPPLTDHTLCLDPITIAKGYYYLIQRSVRTCGLTSTVQYMYYFGYHIYLLHLPLVIELAVRHLKHFQVEPYI